MKIINIAEIKEVLSSIDIISAIEQGFVLYSQGKTVLPPVGELTFQDPPGDMHIKYGYILQDEYYVVKVSSGFYDNPRLNLPSSNGLMLLFSRKTGSLLSILLDEGYLTDIRTAAAGAIVAKYLAPTHINKIGVIGAGIQAKLHLIFLKKVISCREVIVFGRDPEKLLKFKIAMEKEGFTVKTTQKLEELTSECGLIITTTPSSTPLLFANHIQKGTHITAVGADTPHKQEIDSSVFSLADSVVVDSIAQCIERGDTAYAIKNKAIEKNQLLQLGNVIAGVSLARLSDDQITMADLTGLAVQDLQIAKAVYRALT